jgi:hypothetical protein
MPNRIPTPGIKGPVVRTSKSAQPAAKPKATPSVKATTTADRAANAPRPAVGADIDARKKFGKKSWNNGYTN